MKFQLLIFALFAGLSMSAQQEFKTIPAKGEPANINVNNLDFRGDLIPASKTLHPRPRPMNPALLSPLIFTGTPGVKVLTDKENGQVYALEGRPANLPSATPEKSDAYAYLTAVAASLGLENPYQEIVITEEKTDELGQVHLRLQQQFKGLPVYPSDARLHASGPNGFDFFTGRFIATPTDLNTVPTLSEEVARTQVQSKFEEQWINLPAEQLDWLSGPQLASELVIYAPAGQSPALAYRIESRPNLLKHSIIYLDAHSGDILNEYSHVCGFFNEHHTKHLNGLAVEHVSPASTEARVLDPDGPYTTTQQNLFDQNQTINTFSLQDTFYLLDGTREMFTTANNQIDGFLLTYDGLSGSPQRDDFNPSIAISLNNQDWSKTGVSVHGNAGEAYQYFFDKFSRNSIDGIGGNVLSIMNVNETDGTQMDNAFWNGRALFYGNGVSAFNRLPRGLDVAGHEMAHGVIQSTADLVYQDQPGAMNESFADVFGYLVEGETGDYRIGEDVVQTNVFTSGAMRNLQFPNNGASGPSDFRWQPKHMDEYVNTQEDNGGVHINSGIPNRAFYLFSSNSAVGDSRAEQVYYRALSMYLTRSSRFADLRIAVVRAAGDLYGDDVIAAANAAFDGVGIGGDGGDYTVDIDANEGDRFLLLTNVGQSALFLAEEDGTITDAPLETVGLLSRPSITDDGAAAVFIDDQNRVRIYNFNTRTLSFLEGEPQTIWRNVAVSKDGTKLALTTTDNDNIILIFDFASGLGQNMALFNPTTSNTGISTGDVQYADALEWEPGGEFLMYDALSRLDEGLEFWDIGFLRAWDNDANNFGDGTIQKLSNNLPEGTSIGNPTFSRNSPYIIAFEEVNFTDNSFELIGANTETGETATIFQNNIVNYPNFGIDDDRVVFDAQQPNGDRLLADQALAADKISPSGETFVLVEGGHWGHYFANGERDLETGLEGPVVEDNRVKVYPTLTDGLLTIEAPASNNNTPVLVLDVNGRVAKSLSALGAGSGLIRTEVSLEGLTAGAYFLAVPVEGGVVVKRVVVR